ncbi:MAG: hydrogenase formation protein HypD [Deltaproteobacteria bacterium]|nr:hydrogenase formation protein HypD [Deltaproteobacteria bacterium]
MKFSEEFRDQALVKEAVRRLGRLSDGPAVIMEVCGTHTMSVARFGLKSLLPAGVRLVSGPGCPVCVTAQEDIDAFLALGERPNTILATFGDMMRVPGSAASLERRRAEGVDARVVYAPLDAVDIARQNPNKDVIFFGVGFETTMPATALAIEAAAREQVGNFSVFCVHKTMPRALRALLASGSVNVSGLLLPGHVTAIIGAEAYTFISEEFRIPSAVTGFEPLDILWGIESILRQLREKRAVIDNAYSRAVKNSANPLASRLLEKVFEPTEANWRGLGVIPESGVKLREEFSQADASVRFREIVAAVPPARPSACRCGEVLRGVLTPSECRLFAKACTPSQPLGPCMVSSEGACAAAFRFEL